MEDTFGAEGKKKVFSANVSNPQKRGKAEALRKQWHQK